MEGRAPVALWMVTGFDWDTSVVRAAASLLRDDVFFYGLFAVCLCICRMVVDQ